LGKLQRRAEHSDAHVDVLGGGVASRPPSLRLP